MQQPQCRLGAHRSGDARHQPQQGKFTPQRTAQQALACAQRAIHHQLLTSLTHPHLHLSHQQQAATQHHQHHHHFQCTADLLQHAAHLFEDRADIQQAERRELTVELG
ncbi:hypothetical protein D3C76_1410670 [compost metagenome]